MTSTKDTILRLLMRRHALIERARDAKAIALIVGTLAAGNDV
jgi:diphthamide synthase subunit DPH2